MFSLHEYVSFGDTKHDHSLAASEPISEHCLLLFWSSMLYPSFPLEKMFPFIIMIKNKHKVHPIILELDAFKHFKNVYFSNANNVIYHVEITNHTQLNSCFDLFLKQTKTYNCKSQRIISIHYAKYKTVLQNLVANDLFYYASKLIYFNENHDTVFIIFNNILRIQILLSIQSFIEQSSDFSSNDFMIFPYSTKAKQRQHVLIIKTQFVSIIQHFILCEWVSDSSSIRKNAMLVSPFLSSFFTTNDITIFSTIKTLLRWFCVSRTQYRGLIQPGEPGFKMYKYLPLMLSCFSIRRELSKYHTRKFVSSTNKKIDNTVPNFLRGLKSFLQLKHEHYIDYKSICTIHNYLHGRKHLQRVFPQIWDITNHIMFTTKKRVKISLNDIFVMNGKNYPSYMFLYGMILHKNVPKKIKQMIWLNTYTSTPMVLPSKLKGIEHMHRHQTIYKTYSDYVAFDCDSLKRNDHEFLQLMVCLEFRSYMNPSKLSFKISNIPSIKLSKLPSNFPIMTKDKTKTNDEFDKKSYIYSHSSWVVRNLDLPYAFSCKREFLLDELLIYGLKKQI